MFTLKFPFLTCLSEVGLFENEIKFFIVPNYERVTYFAKLQENRGGGVGIFKHSENHSGAKLEKIDISNYCKEYLLEAWAVKIEFKKIKAVVYCLYRPYHCCINNFLKNSQNSQ